MLDNIRRNKIFWSANDRERENVSQSRKLPLSEKNEATSQKCRKWKIGKNNMFQHVIRYTVNGCLGVN